MKQPGDRLWRVAPGEGAPPAFGWTKAMFFCPGCRCGHGIDDRWTVSGTSASPTLNPSYLVIGGPTQTRCHSFVRDGRIEFLSDSTHALAGKTVDLPTWEEMTREEGRT